MQEMDFAAACLRVDAKNYHAWGHRHAMLQAFELWEAELELTSLLLQDDPYNNSAWSQRHAAFSMALARSAHNPFSGGTSTSSPLGFPSSRTKEYPSICLPWQAMSALRDLLQSIRTKQSIRTNVFWLRPLKLRMGAGTLRHAPLLHVPTPPFLSFTHAVAFFAHVVTRQFLCRRGIIIPAGLTGSQILDRFDALPARSCCCCLPDRRGAVLPTQRHIGHGAFLYQALRCISKMAARGHERHVMLPTLRTCSLSLLHASCTIIRWLVWLCRKAFQLHKSNLASSRL